MVRLIRDPRLRKDSAYAFDVAWVIALTLNASMADGLTYERLNKRTYEEVRLIKKWMRNTNFEGITVSKRKKDKTKFHLFLGRYVNVKSHYFKQKFSQIHADVFLRSYYPIRGFRDKEYLRKTINGIQDRILWGKINSIRLFRSDSYILLTEPRGDLYGRILTQVVNRYRTQ